jgi:hypothetical protein
MPDDDVETSLDQTMQLQPLEGRIEIYDHVNEVIEAAMRSGPDVALNYGAMLRADGHVRALQLAHLLWELKERWATFPTDDTFEDAVFKRVGYSQQTVDKYIAVWGRIFAREDIDEERKNELMGKPMNALLAISAAAGANQLNEDQWERIVQAPDVASVKEVVRAVRGEQTSSSAAITITLDRDGYLKAKRGTGHYIPIGYLNLKVEEDFAQEAINRIVRASGVVKR